MIRRILCLFSTLVLFTACTSGPEGPGYNPPETAEQTVLLYMPGTSLIKFYKQNIEGIRQAVNASMPGQGRILVCYQPTGTDKAELSEIYYDRNTRKAEMLLLKSYEQFDAGDPASVRQMFADAAETAPARSYGLIIGCHGKAWMPANAGALSPYAVGQHLSDLWKPLPGALPTRSFGDSGYELDITELADVLSSQAFRPDYLIFDDCFMASIEVLYDLREVVDYVVASPCEIMGAGFPYSRVMPRLLADNGTHYDLPQACEEFWNFYMYDWNSVPNNAQSGCISMAVSAELDGLADVMKRINAAPKKGFDANSLQSYEGFTNHAFYDLQHYVESSCADAALVTEFNTVLDRAFPRSCRLNTPEFYSAYNKRMNPVTHYSGVTISDPTANFSVKPYLDRTNWYRKTH